MYQPRKKNLTDFVAIYGRGRELFRPPTYITVFNLVREYRRAGGSKLGANPPPIVLKDRSSKHKTYRHENPRILLLTL
jgi:hypothetical protein